MQIGIDLGATKIESVLLDAEGSELHRSRKESPQNYKDTIAAITESVNLIEKKFKKNFNVGVDLKFSEADKNFLKTGTSKFSSSFIISIFLVGFITL